LRVTCASSRGSPITRPPLNVLITVDTEFSPRDFHAANGEIRGLVERDIDGITPEGRFGIGYQMDLLERHGLKAVFQVEALAASAIGPEALRRIVREVQDRGHEVQMHVHAEWLEALDLPGLPPFRGRNLVSYTADEQARILEHGLRNMRDAGAVNVCAFRAGNYGANRDTLKAVARSGLRYDTSWNVCYLDPSMATEELLLTQPALLEGVIEVPISFFKDWPGHCRPAQLCACSHREMTHALLQAWEAGWKTFVVVSHSFELIKRIKESSGGAVPDRLVIRRMEGLCRFLGDHKDKFRSAVFADLDPSDIVASAAAAPLRSKLSLTIGRMTEQLLGRFS
jgi:hypothetical protein